MIALAKRQSLDSQTSFLINQGYQESRKTVPLTWESSSSWWTVYIYRKISAINRECNKFIYTPLWYNVNILNLNRNFVTKIYIYIYTKYILLSEISSSNFCNFKSYYWSIVAWYFTRVTILTKERWRWDLFDKRRIFFLENGSVKFNSFSLPFLY